MCGKRVWLEQFDGESITQQPWRRFVNILVNNKLLTGSALNMSRPLILKEKTNLKISWFRV